MTKYLIEHCEILTDETIKNNSRNEHRIQQKSKISKENPN